MFRSKLLQKMTSCFMVLTVLLLSGCSSTTMINSNPSGARVTIDGRTIGTTPLSYSDRAVVGSSRNVVLKLDGHKTKVGKISRDGDINVGAVVGRGILPLSIPLDNGLSRFIHL